MQKDCLECGNHSSRENAEFCTNCGTSLAANSCSDYNCDAYEEELGAKECYCYICGSKTTYHEKGNANPELPLPF